MIRTILSACFVAVLASTSMTAMAQSAPAPASASGEHHHHHAKTAASQHAATSTNPDDNITPEQAAAEINMVYNETSSSLNLHSTINDASFSCNCTVHP